MIVETKIVVGYYLYIKMKYRMIVQFDGINLKVWANTGLLAKSRLPQIMAEVLFDFG
ncbi:MAG: hypothetical protein Q4D16_21385 [Eubacteriales bacterium]|nr:hypothetical protein [Eubacteriales bacterium]